MNILFVGGGSIGHIAPSVAVWEALQELHPEATAHFVCSTKPGDAAFLEQHQLPFAPLDAPRMSLSLPWKFLQALKESRCILQATQPDIIFSKGGYVSLPLCLAARGKVPIVLHESDAVSGRANALVQRWAVRTISTFPDSPIRTAMTQGSRDRGLSISGLTGNRPILLVLGGSQGALDVNESIVRLLPELLKQMDIIHVTGKGKGSSVQEQGYFATEFANEELADFYATASMAVSRAGASMISELRANGIPTILVPLRGVAHDHQEVNARSVSEADDMFTVLEQEELEGALLGTLEHLVQQPRKKSGGDTSRHIAQILLETLAKGEQHQ